MIHLMSQYENESEKDINFDVMNRRNGKKLYEYVIDCFKSIENVLKEIHLVEYSFNSDTEKVNQSEYEITRSNKQKDKSRKYIYMNDSHPGEIEMKFRVDFRFDDGGGNVVEDTLWYTRKMLIPLPDEDGYYNIKGNRYILELQLTESTTYTTPGTLVGKSLLPIKVRKNKTIEKDLDGNYHDLDFYEVLIFNKYRVFLFFYFADMGWSNTLEYMEVGKYIKAIPTGDYDDYDPEYIHFRINMGLSILVKRNAMMSDYIQSMLGSILKTLNNRTKYEDLESSIYWMCRIGAFKTNSKKSSHYILGKRHLTLFNRMLDEGTKNSIRLTHRNRKDVHSFIRWMIQNYKELYAKDNLDIGNKRIRYGEEYAAALLNEDLSRRIKSFVNTTANTPEKLKNKYDNFFSFRGGEIMNKLHSSGLLRYDNNVNDLNFFEKYKVTQKGPNSIGAKNDGRTVSMKRRSLHPSHLNRIDLNVCSQSDPGQTNYISPFCKTDGLYFEGAEPEPESFSIKFKRELSENDYGDDCPVIVIDPVLYNNVIEGLDDCHIQRMVSVEEYENVINTVNNIFIEYDDEEEKKDENEK